MIALVSLLAGTPNRIHWFTGQIWANSKGLHRILFKFIDKLIFLISHHVLVDSISQRKFLIKEKIVSFKKSSVLHKGSVGGVDINRFKFNYRKRIQLRKKLSISNNTFVFLYLGRINRDKGVIDLIKAFEGIDNNHDVLLIFVGSFEDASIKDLIKKKKFLYFDYSKNPEEWYSLADILCLPSHREGFGTVVIESAACGLPSLCSKIYGLKDALIDYKTGFFHKVGIAEDIKNKMLYIINNKRFVKNSGKLARKRVIKDFDQKIITKELLKLINSILLNDKKIS